jgi:hypothetical protein
MIEEKERKGLTATAFALLGRRLVVVILLGGLRVENRQTCVRKGKRKERKESTTHLLSVTLLRLGLLPLLLILLAALRLPLPLLLAAILSLAGELVLSLAGLRQKLFVLGRLVGFLLVPFLRVLRDLVAFEKSALLLGTGGNVGGDFLRGEEGEVARRNPAAVRVRECSD